ncbi:hypothetical protein PpBr36_05491 [Pyricularia pennisetigena]|uniref:hypothetical protein n=1 Tax=Pyricularia pennisetigena TaxID=1578925 RepID=UPI0011510A82|nr:hypothetical protein PpBr36_05491 [Pyricularia pennisetigena]TLS26551.1 hypothetical protein PpBr36_05491 [Pyricularia pennisetigena]
MAAVPGSDVVVGEPSLAPERPDTVREKTSQQGEAQTRDNFQRASVQDAQEPVAKQTGSAALMEEIHMLREQLFKLGDRVADQMGHEINDDPETDATQDSELVKDDSKRSRRRRKATKWVGKRETRAAELQKTDRTRGEMPYLVFIQDDGTNDFDASLKPKTGREEDIYWDLAYADRGFGPSRISTTTRRVLPMTSLRKQHSRKLGPPTQWDTSDSDQWDSDDTTRTKDFDYFRARLRGDFEWEIERLMAQKERYERNKKKKNELAMKGKHAKTSKPRESEQHALLTVFQSTWPGFDAMWDQPLENAFAIDVLIGEPQITLPSYFDKGFLSTSRRRKHTMKKEPEAHSGSSLPERIRIHSKQIIKTLSVICGEKLNPEDDDGPVVLLRPFRLLTAYATDIREWHSNLSHATEASTVAATTTGLTKEPETAGQQTTHGDNGQPISNNNVKPADVSSDEKKETDPAAEIDPLGYSRSKKAAAHLECLIEFMDDYIVKRQTYLNSSSCSKVFFSDLWHLYKPGDFVISAETKQIFQVFRVDLAPHRAEGPWAAYFQKPNDGESDEEKMADNFITIGCVHIDFDGYQLGPVINQITIDSFNGEKPVTSLAVYPLRLHHQKDVETRSTMSEQSEQAAENHLEKLRERLIQRGRLFVDVAGIKHKYYAGLTVRTMEEIESQVMIDFQEAFAVEKNKHWTPKITRLAGQPEPRDDRECRAECCVRETVFNDSFIDYSRYRDFIQRLMPGVEGNQVALPSVAVFPRWFKDMAANKDSLTDDELLIMSYEVPGFVLRDRTWAWLDLEYLSDVVSSVEGGKAYPTSSDDDEEDHGAFGQLVLPDGHKNMVLSLVSQHFRNKHKAQGKDEQTDIVRGKGKGLIILLHGAPGVGKTTTAGRWTRPLAELSDSDTNSSTEGVADRFKKPLFQMTCGDLGSTASEVERGLQTNFSLANKWDCVLLLDEADVFLAERRRTDFHRNGLVAVFLRVLEYYAGILFLTTNRIGDFDEAFASRIHMSLYYPQLTEISTIKVFKLNLRLIKNRYAARNRKIKIDEDEILQTAGAHWRSEPEARWNGRQIRNACQTALALAEYEAQPEGAKFDLNVDNEDRRVHLTVAYLNKVTQAYLDFMKYLKAVHGTDAERRARESGLRAIESMAAAFANKEAVNVSRGDGLAAWNLAGGSQQRSASPGNPAHHQGWSSVSGYGQAAYAHDPRSSGARNYERGYQTQPVVYPQEQ